MTDATLAQTNVQGPRKGIAPSRHGLRAIAVWGIAVLILLVALQTDVLFARFWAFGLAFGFVLQRGRFCFASAFRDLFLLGHGRNMKGVLVGLAVASVGFAIMMARQIPTVDSGFFPPTANILPVGVHTVLGGLLFGIGMVVAGGCVSGTLYRMGEGYVGSWIAFTGLVFGLLVSGYTWNWWWQRSIAISPRIWLPTYLGHSGALALTLVLLGLVFIGVLWIEHRAGMILPSVHVEEEPTESVADDLRAVARKVFVRGWPIVITGAVLGGLNVLLFVAQEPWGFTGEIGRWAIDLATLFGATPPTIEGTTDLPGCVMVPSDGSIANHMTFLVVGMWFGALAGALGAGEFKLRVPKQPARYVQSAGGGVLMGYGAGIAMGCTIGAFFSSIPSLAMNGWVFALFLGVGAWIGTLIIQRIA